MRKSRLFTLLEVMIALSLASILLSGLMVSYYQISKKRILAQNLKKNQLQVELMHQRLLHLFSKVECADRPYLEISSHSEASGPCLIFEFDHGVDRELRFCGNLKGMLYCNSRGQICLTSWQKEGFGRSEVLLEGVNGLEFSFFDAEEKKLFSEWKKKNPLPVFLKMAWNFSDQKKQKEAVVFFFSKRGPVLYKGEGI